MKIELKPIDSLIPYIRNPRVNQKAVPKVKSSIKEFGFRQPIVVDTENVIVVGHTRWLAAKELGITEVPVHVADSLTPAQIQAYRIADNRTNEEADWDTELLSIELVDLKASGFNLELTGFDTKEIDEFITVPSDESVIDEDETPEVAEETTIKSGDLYILGKHRVLCCDNSIPENIERLFAGEKPEACISDPPYGINFNTDYTRFMIKRGRNNKHKPINDDNHAFDPTQYLGYKSVVLFGANYFAEHLPVGTWLVWDKRYDNGQSWLSDAELAWMKGGTGVYIKHIIWQGFARSDLKGMSTTSEGIEHPTQKPVSLMMWCMEKSKAGELVFDPFLGSGTTLMACEQLEKRCFGCEIEPKYVDVIIRRWERMTGLKAVLEQSHE